MTSFGSRVVVLFLAASVAFATSCGTDAPSDRAVDQPAVPATVTGVITEIDSEALDEVRSFTLKDGDDVYEVHIADDVEYGFPLGHLQAHLTGAEPVTVKLEERNGALVALSIEDA